MSVHEVIASRDSALAEAAGPALGQWGEWLTIALAIVATISGLVASMFAVSRMLAMLTSMELVPHSHFGMPGRVQTHTLVYTAVLSLVLDAVVLGAFVYAKTTSDPMVVGVASLSMGAIFAGEWYFLRRR